MNKSSSPTSLSLVQGVSSIYQPPQILERALLLSQSFDFLLTLCTSFLFFESLSSSWLLSSADLWVIPPILWKFSIWPMVLLLLLSRFSHVRLCATPWTAAYQASPSMGFSRQAYWSGVPLPSLWDLWLFKNWGLICAALSCLASVVYTQRCFCRWLQYVRPCLLSCSVMSDSQRPYGL